MSKVRTRFECPCCHRKGSFPLTKVEGSFKCPRCLEGR